MKTIRMLEWKRLYPIKKVILAGLWLFAAFTCGTGVYGHIRDIDRNSLYIAIGFGIGALVSFRPIKNYIMTPFHCVPYLNKLLSKEELGQMLEQEQFTEIPKDECQISRHLISISEHWLCVKGRLISKDLLVFGYTKPKASLLGRNPTPMVFTYVTGVVLKIDLRTHLRRETRRSLKDYFWNKEGILISPYAEIERILSILREQSSRFQEEAGISEAELVREILKNPDQFRPVYMEKLPYYVKDQSPYMSNRSKKEKRESQKNGKKNIKR